jgi:hypothetical protein
LSRWFLGFHLDLNDWQIQDAYFNTKPFSASSTGAPKMEGVARKPVTTAKVAAHLAAAENRSG